MRTVSVTLTKEAETWQRAEATPKLKASVPEPKGPCSFFGGSQKNNLVKLRTA